jgi:hypothetical protein
MGKNSKPILSVLVDEDKKEKFADLARLNKYSMGWLLNDCIDRMLAADSIDIYGEPARSPQSQSISTLPIDTSGIENLINTYIDKLDIENLINTSISNLDILDPSGVRELIRESTPPIVSVQVEPLADLITELEAYTRSQIETLRNDLKKPLAIAR